MAGIQIEAAVCCVITQKYNVIVKDFRQNIQVLVFFYDKATTCGKFMAIASLGITTLKHIRRAPEKNR